MARDRDLWLVGGKPHVRRVIIFLFRRTAPGANTVQASVEVWGLDQQQNPAMLQREVRKCTLQISPFYVPGWPRFYDRLTLVFAIPLRAPAWTISYGSHVPKSP
jgi:hypothetical protein